MMFIKIRGTNTHVSRSHRWKLDFSKDVALSACKIEYRT